MFKFMKKLSPVISPMIALLFLFSSTVSFVQAATNTSAQMYYLSNQAFIKSLQVQQQGDLSLFDKDTDTRYAPQQSVLVEKSFSKQTALKGLSVYGASDYALTIEYKVNGLWERVAVWDSKSLSSLNSGWNTFSLKEAVETDSVRMTLNPLVSHPKGLAEIKFETQSDEKIDLLTKSTVTQDSGVTEEQHRVYRAKEKVATLNTDVNLSKEGTFSMDIGYHPEQIEKVVLSYEVSGVTGGASVIRAINDELAQGGLLVQANTPTLSQGKSIKVSEEINPAWLTAGTNKIRFISHEAGDLPLAYQVKNTKLSLTFKNNSKVKSVVSSKLIAFQPQTGLYYNDYAYIRGFVTANNGESPTITVDGKQIKSTLGAFETLVKADSTKDVKIVATFANGKTLSKTLFINTNFSLHQPKHKMVQLSTNAVKLLHDKKVDVRGKAFIVQAKQKTELHFKSAKLNIQKEALQTKREIKVLSLNTRDLPKLDQGMVNVTKGDVEGYRFLPHGIKFDKKSDLKLAFDASKLPKGTTAKDVKTYFFDEETGRWLALEKVASASDVIHSKTNHFTDMINAVIQTPDAPQAKAYGATQIKDLKVANPGAKVNLIQAPKASAMGDAQVSYPLEIPAGRQGVAPKLGVSYSSGGGNSWMGLGWNLSVPSIGIDTRWGVPRYDTDLETETYTIVGQQLAPVAHRSASVARTGEKTFHPRVEGSFNKIIRHGSSPKSYWWEVTSKNGAKNFYGGTLGSGVDDDAVLKDADGNIAHWALVSSLDTYGNTATYSYTKVEDTGVRNNEGTVPGYQLYIKNINYTGYNGNSGAYDVEFLRDRELADYQRRSDVSIDARLGFKRVTADLLRKVEVKFQGTTLRSYDFVYTKGAFEKTLLEKIKQYDANGAHFNTHTFSYFDEIRDGNGKYVAFKTEKFWIGESIPPEDEVGNGDIPTIPTIPTPGTVITPPTITPPEEGLINTVNDNIKGLVNALTHANELSRVQLDIEGILTQGDSLFHASKENNGFDRAQFTLTQDASIELTQTARDGKVDLIYPSSDELPLDYVRVWKAPFDGTITIDAPLALVETQSNENADGVRVAVQHQSSELWSSTIAADDFSVKIPNGVENVTVKEGDQILFRVQALSNGINDIVSWSPVVTYNDKPQEINDANKLPLYNYSATKAYIPQAKAVELPQEGLVYIEGNITKPLSSDDVTFTLINFTASGEQTKVWEQTYPASQSVQLQPNFGLIEVNVGDKLFAMISTQSNVDFKAVTWNPVVSYESSKKSFADRIILGDIDIASFNEEITPHYTIHQSVKNSYGWKVSQTATLSIEAIIPDNFEGSGVVHFTVKSEGKRIAVQNITLFEGTPSSYEPLNVDVIEGEQIYFEYHYAGDFTNIDSALWMPKVTVGTESVNIDTLGLYDLPASDNGVLYRGWGEYFYDASKEESASSIALDKLQSIPSEFVVGAAGEESATTQEDTTSTSEAATKISAATAPQVAISSTTNNVLQEPTQKVVSSVAPVQSAQSTTSAGMPSDASSLSGSTSESSTVHMSVTAGPFDGNLFSKSNTAGGKVGSSKSESEGTLAMVDIDGDSLPDQVIVSGSALGYKKNLSQDGIESFAPFKSISGVSAFHHSKTTSSNKGLESHFGIFAGYNKSKSSSTTDIYFADVNGDGLIDIVSKGVVYYNQINSLGIPTFTTTSTDTPNPIDESGTLSAGGWVEPQTPQELAQLEQENPLHDTIRVWQAPEAGTISIAAPVNLIEDTSDKRVSYSTADGVHVAIQHKGTELWSATIGAEDYTVKTPQSVNAIIVAKGDRIYFRVQSVYDGMYDNVNWAPKITYTDKVQSFDANHLSNYSFDVNEDFLLSGYDITMPISGTISISSTFSKPATSDDVVLRLVKVDVSGNIVTIWEENTGKNAQSKNINLTRSVQSGESYRFEVRADTNVDWAKVSWKPTITYTHSIDPNISIVDAAGNPQFVLHATATLNPYAKVYKTTTLWTPTSTTTAQITTQLQNIPTANGSVVFSVKKDRTLLGKQTLRYENGVLITPVTTLSVAVVQGDGIYLEYHTTDVTLASLLVNHAQVEIIQNGTTETKQAGIYGYNYAFLFGPMYRNWGQFVYNANDGRASQPIIESELKLDQALTQTPNGTVINSATDKDSLESALQADGYDPATSILVLMIPRGDVGAWQGMDQATQVGRTTVRSSRFGLKNLIEDNLIPSSGGTASIRGINKIVKTKAESYSLSAGIGAGISDQEISTLTDFKDMNGDRYPDIIGKNQLQYTTMLGALEGEATNSIQEIPTYGTSESKTLSYGGTFPSGKVDTSGQSTSVTASTNDPNPGISGNIGLTSDETHYTLRDINGDGLPDRLYDDGRAALNLGYSFAQIENWAFGKIKRGESTPYGGGLGINIGHYSFSVGLSINTSDNEHVYTLTDLNSDGLIDEAYVANGVIKAKLNTGNGFASEVTWTGASKLYESESINGDISATFTGCIPLVPPVIVAKICFNPGGSIGEGSSHDEATLTDINGDGFLDFLRSSDTSNLGVSTSTIGKTNLLNTVQRPLGAKITIDYARSGNTYENPHHKWVLSDVSVFDGHTGDGSDTMKQEFAYEDGYYDRHEREFYGFAWVTTADVDTANASAVYRKNLNHFINDNYYEKGLLDYTKVTDGADKLYIEKFNAYDTVNIFTKNVLTDIEKMTDDQITFSKLVQAQTLYYEGQQSAGQQTAIEYEYDKYGNVITQLDLGDFNDANDNWAATVTYNEDLTNYIVSVPQTIKIYDENGNLLRDRDATIDEHGAVTQVRIKTGLTTLASDISYDQYGNLASITYPQNHKGQRYTLSYIMDDVVQTYTTSMSDSFGYTATAGYDYRFGAQLSQADINNQPINTTIDSKGRITTITGPLESGLGTATIAHSYYPDASTPYALTQHYDEGRADTIDTATLIDGLMRVIQTKKDAAIDVDKDGLALDAMAVSGHVIFDSFGRSISTYYPVSETVGNAGVFNATIDGIAPTRTSYDILDRKLLTTLPDGATLRNAYGFKSDRDGVTRFHTSSTDANSNTAESFKDIRERITSVLQHNPLVGQANIWTSYSYNAVNELLQVKDDKGNLTQAIYDIAGRRTHINNPDTGWLESIYDDSGNVIAKITDNLRAEGKVISYVYDYTRLTNINYPNNTEHDVTYTYGNVPAQYNAGRITKITDASGERLFEYGKLGETTKETRTLFTYTNTDPKTYVTQYRYDTWNRLRELTYPDMEVLTHNYDSGGKLNSLQGVKGEYSYDYLKALTYDKFGQRVFTKYLNDTTATYAYEEDRRRLSNIVATDASRTFMDNRYSYDKMQNILSVSNAAAVEIDSPHFGGETSQSFSYDNLYQLKNAEGSWTNRQGHQHRYDLAMSYDSIGNIKTKNQNHERLPLDGDKWVEQQGTTYDWTYDHEVKQPHAPSKIGNRTFTYDLNGNQTGWESTQNANNRVIEWDEENRISTISDNGHTSYYIYDAGGERTLKRSAQGETFYVNAYFVIREGQVASKHFFAGSQRIATKLTKQESQTIPGRTKEAKPPKIIYEKEQYFYHSDHLGSSSFVTDEKGEVYEHLEYFPFGETWAHEHSNTQVTPYRFTGKEYDEVTGLYYYGARYYDPRTSVWQSPDPILETYMNGKTNGGVFNPRNLSLFTYTANNPVNLIDPDGESSKAVARAIPLAVGAAVADGPFPIGDAIGAMILIAAALAFDNDKIDTAVATTIQTKEKDKQFVVRVQVQGKKMKQELHLPIQKNEPVTDKEAKLALGSLKSQLSKSDKKLLGNAFTKAEKWINNVAESGGIGPVGSKSFTEKGVSPNDARVDVEVLRGPINLTKEPEVSR